MKKPNTTKSDLLKAFDKSEKKTISDVCRIVGITPGSFHFHQRRNPDFRRQVMAKRLEYLTMKLAVETNNGGENV
jgi:hypothetical protein